MKRLIWPCTKGNGGNPGRRERRRVVDVLPRLPAYVRCFALMSMPAVATTIAIIFLRTATNGVQSSIYVVYLKGIGLTGTSIGTLFAAIGIRGGLHRKGPAIVRCLTACEGLKLSGKAIENGFAPPRRLPEDEKSVG